MNKFDMWMKAEGLSIEADKPEEAARIYAQYQEHLTEEAKAANGEALESLKKEIGEAQAKEQAERVKQATEIMAAIRKHAEALSDMQASNRPKPSAKGLLEELKAKHGDLINSMKTGGPVDLSFKTTTTASLTDGTVALRLPEVGREATRRPSAYEYFMANQGGQFLGVDDGGRVKYIDADPDEITRAAAQVAEGELFPLSSIEWKEYNEPLKKAGDMIPWTDEFERDLNFLYNELTFFLRQNLALHLDNQLINGVGTTTNLTGVLTYATEFTAPSNVIQDANVYDLIIKMAEVITTTAGSRFMPDVVMAPQSVINNMRLKKDENNNYIVPPFVTADGRDVAGMTVLAIDVMPANTLVVADSNIFRMYGIDGLVAERGYINDDFRRGKKHMRLEQRLLLLVRNLEKAGLLKCTDIADALIVMDPALPVT